MTAIPMTIFDVAVFGIPSEQWGEQVHAMLVLSPGAPLSEADVIAYARQHLAAYKLLPLGVRARARASCSSASSGHVLDRAQGSSDVTENCLGSHVSRGLMCKGCP